MRNPNDPSVTFERGRTIDPLRIASRRVEIHYQEAVLAANREQQQRAREHLTTLNQEQAEQAESLRADRARLAALDALARVGEGGIPDPELAEERRKLRVRLEQRPATLTAALEADLQRLESEAKHVEQSLERNRQWLADDEAIKAQCDEERVQDILRRLPLGQASPAERQFLSQMGRYPDPKR